MADEHKKIVRQAAKEQLEPLGFFQVGQTRRWVRDDGWYFTVVDFGPTTNIRCAALHVYRVFWSSVIAQSKKHQNMHSSIHGNTRIMYLKPCDNPPIFLKVSSALGKCLFGIVGIVLCTFISEVVLVSQMSLCKNL